MRFGMAALLVLALGAAFAMPAHAAPPAPVAVSSVAPAALLAAETGDVFPPWIIDFSFWVCARLIDMFATLTDVVVEGLKEAREHGDSKLPPTPDPVLANPPLTSPGSPSPRLEP